MSKVIFSSIFNLVLLVIWALQFLFAQAQDSSSPLPPSQGEAPTTLSDFTNDELRQLLEILDEQEPPPTPTPPPPTPTPPPPASKEPVHKFESHPLLHLGELLLDEEDDLSQNQVMESSIPTPTTTMASTTTTTTSTTTTPMPTTLTTTITPQISRREDITQPPAEQQQPTHEQLVQQLSLFNSLLMSLSVENVTQAPSPDGPPPMTEQQITLLKSLFGNFTPLQTTETSASQFLRRQTESPSSTNLLNQTPSPSSPEILALSELLTKIAKAPTDANGNLNLQSITGIGGSGSSGSVGGVTPDHLKHFHTNNANMDAAASNQLSTLLNLLGTLGSLSQAQQQFQQQPAASSLFNLVATPTLAPPISTNFLTNLLLNQQSQQGQASQTSPNIFGNLFNQQQQQPLLQAHEQQQPFNFGSLIAPGIGSALSTMSNIFGGSGPGGKPRVRGKGVDTRLGLGYRFGDAADAQIMWDVGPGLFTEPLQNEAARYPQTKKKRQDSPPPTSSPPPPIHIQAAAQAEKEQQQMAASRRYYQLHPPPSHHHHKRVNSGQHGYQSRKSYLINPPTTRKPFFSAVAGVQNLTPYAQEAALKELWQMMEMKKQYERMQQQQQAQKQQSSSSYPANFFNSLTPAEMYQIQRQKHIIKRASTQSAHLNPDPTHPTTDVGVNNNVDHLLGSESFLRFRKMPPNSGNNPHYSPPGFSGKRSQPKISPPPSQKPGLFSNLNIFGRFRGPPKQQQQPQHPSGVQRPNNRPTQSDHPNMMMMSGTPSQMSRWDMDTNHRFDNFKNTNGELVMTDSNSEDRFYLRNRNANGEFVGA